MDPQARVIVVGAGIGGLTSAIALRKAGIPVLVLERATELREIGAAIGVQTNAVHALRDLGVAEALLKIGVPLEYYEYYSWRGTRLARWSQGEIGRKLGEPTVVVHRADLQGLLLDALPADIIQLGTTCTGYTEDERGVTVRLDDGSEIGGRFLIGADGFNSVVRRQLLGDSDPRYSGWSAYRAVTQSSDGRFPVGIARQVLGSGCSFGMWHISDGRVYWVATIRQPADSHADEAAGGRKAYVHERFRSAGPLVSDLIEKTDADAILRNEVYDRVPVTTWSSTRVTLLGDAAHPTTPVTGQGGGQAMIDASVLVHELGARGLDDPGQLRQALRAYEERRMPVTSSITNEAWRIAAMHHFTNPAAAWARDLSLRLTPTRVWNARMEQRLAF